MQFSSNAMIVFLLASVACSVSAAFSESMLDSLPGMGSTPPVLGSNVEGGSVFANYINARNHGQFFVLREAMMQYEKPSSPIINAAALMWCSNLKFTNIENTSTSTSGGHSVGYTAQCMFAVVQDALESMMQAAGAQSTTSLTADQFVATLTCSAVYVPSVNAFVGQQNKNTDNYSIKFWDDGTKYMSGIGYEVHDAGDISANQATSSWSEVTDQLTWLSVDEAASLFKGNVDDFTPDVFNDMYRNVWSNNPSHAETIEGKGMGEVGKDVNYRSSGSGRRFSVTIPIIASILLGFF